MAIPGLQIGLDLIPEVREYSFPSSMDCGILFMTDFHVRYRRPKLLKFLRELVQNRKPDLILLGGDYLESSGSWVHFREVLEILTAQCPVLAILGNHDFQIRGFDLKVQLEGMGVQVIEKQTVVLRVNSGEIQISGNQITEVNPKADFSILLLHNPALKNMAAAGYRLVLAGHLHGGQWVFWKRGKILYPGALVYRWNILEGNLSFGKYIQSKGLGDTLPIRYACPTDVVWIQLHSFYT
jgi:predicted MPP superfamily phosphohydrolase